MEEPKESTMSRDEDTDSYAWMKILEAAAKPESKLWKDVETMDGILGQLVSSSTVKSRAFLVKTGISRLHTWHHGFQGDLNVWQNFLNFLHSTLRRRGCCARRKVQIDKKRSLQNISNARRGQI